VHPELITLMRRQVEALELVEARLRALELLVAADEQRFVAAALDEVEAASERLAALELGRVLSLSTAGYGPDTPASELLSGCEDPDLTQRFTAIVEGLQLAVARVGAARERALAVVGSMAEELQERLELAGAPTGSYG
jgi:hypothetical protein